jgi:hypothetical protein
MWFAFDGSWNIADYPRRWLACQLMALFGYLYPRLYLAHHNQLVGLITIKILQLMTFNAP